MTTTRAPSDFRAVLHTVLIAAEVAVAGCHRRVAQTASAEGGASGSLAGQTGDSADGSAGAGGAQGSSNPAAAGATDWAHWPMPNPPWTGLPNPESYDATPAGTVVDKVTGLIWQRSVGASALLWQEAESYCTALSVAGAGDWRLPSLIELTSIVDFTQSGPAVDKIAFPDAVQGNFWTSTAVAGSAGESWYVAFSSGFSYQGHADFLRIGARCVRSPARPAGVDGPRYSYTAAVVRDAQTGLTWQRTVDGGATYAWADAATYCRALNLAGGGWRLASMKELQTLVDVSRQAPAIDPTAFPSSPMEQFWTSSALVGSSTDAWSVGFRLGAVSSVARDNPGFVRCVR